jgi:hypothetical protein
MKHIFTFIAAISLLICLFLVAMTAMTLNSEKTISLGERGDRTYSLKADSLEYVYQGKLTTFDNVQGFKTEPGSFAGIEYDKQVRAQTRTLPAATGFVLVIPALYPIALFAILPLVWVIGKFHKKSNKPAFDAGSADDAPPTRA